MAKLPNDPKPFNPYCIKKIFKHALKVKYKTTMITTPITVTKPYLPPIEDYIEYLKVIWSSQVLTNNGNLHNQLESELANFLGVKYISLFSNGTLALKTALYALNISGEVITTPFSFIATTNALFWNRITPVFSDINPKTYNLEPEGVKNLINKNTGAILPVHIFGHPCDVDHFERIGDEFGIPIIYDAAHSFGVKIKGTSVLNCGDLSILSFHATKVFNTVEGGAIISHDLPMKNKIDSLKNHGYNNQDIIEFPGDNAKMNELQAAMGIVQLKSIVKRIDKLKHISNTYQSNLQNIEGIQLPLYLSNVEYNYSYFPIMINESIFGSSRDQIFDTLKEENIHCKKYFHPLISNYKFYHTLSSSNIENLQVANRVSSEILCLPIFYDLDINIVNKICKLIENRGRARLSC